MFRCVERYFELVRCLYLSRLTKNVKATDIDQFFWCRIGESCTNRSVTGEMREFKHDF